MLLYMFNHITVEFFILIGQMAVIQSQLDFNVLILICSNMRFSCEEMFTCHFGQETSEPALYNSQLSVSLHKRVFRKETFELSGFLAARHIFCLK